MTTCTKCHVEIDELAVFPGGICLTCHDAKTRHLTPEQLLAQVIDGFTIKTTKKGNKQ
jgi:hypothetical protein